MPERAVSEVVSFVLVFSLIVVAVGAIYATGLGGVQGARQTEQVTNAQRAFDVLADNLGDLADTGAPSRATSVKLADASLSFGNPVTVTVTPGPDTAITRRTHPITYRANGGGGAVSYVHGAVIRSDHSGSAVTHPPAFHPGNTTMLTLVIVDPQGRRSVGGSAQVLVRASRTNRTVRTYRTTDHTATVDVSTAHPTAWRNTLTAHENTRDCTVSRINSSQSRVSCTIHTDRVVVRVVTLDVELD